MKTVSQFKKQRQLNNKGFSLVELIVTIAVMGVLIAIAIATSSVQEGSRVSDAEQGISDYVALARTKSMSVAAKEWYMVITKDGNEYRAQIYKTVAEGDELKTSVVYGQPLGSKVEIYYGATKDELDDTALITESNQLKIYFNPSTGRAKQVKLGENDKDITSGLGYIKIVSGTYEATIKVFLNTGKCERE